VDDKSSDQHPEHRLHLHDPVSRIEELVVDDVTAANGVPVAIVEDRGSFYQSNLRVYVGFTSVGAVMAF
jgi:hypothetical protein